jgi:hypothetical protein
VRGQIRHIGVIMTQVLDLHEKMTAQFSSETAHVLNLQRQASPIASFST